MSYPRVDVILEGKEYAIVDRGVKMKEIAVVHHLSDDKQSWGATTNYWNYECYGGSVSAPCTKAEALNRATDLFLSLTNPNYISRSRLEEIGTKCMDGLDEAEPYEAWDFYTGSDLDMEEHELKFFGRKNPYEKEEETDDDDDEYYPPCGMVDCAHKDCPYICEECDGRSEFEVLI